MADEEELKKAVVPITPKEISVRALNEAEKRLQDLQKEVELLKVKDQKRDEYLERARKEEEEEQAAAYASERRRMFEELNRAYEYEREKMYGRLQKALLKQQRNLSLQRLGLIDDGHDSNEAHTTEGTGLSSSGDVLIVTIEKVPGYQIIKLCGEVKGVLPRSYGVFHQQSTHFLLIDQVPRLLLTESSQKELQHALQLAKIVRQECIDLMVASAKQRGANAVVKFEFRSRHRGAESVGEGSQIEYAQIMARGLAVVIKKVPTDKERASERNRLNLQAYTELKGPRDAWEIDNDRRTWGQPVINNAEDQRLWDLLRNAFGNAKRPEQSRYQEKDMIRSMLRRLSEGPRVGFKGVQSPLEDSCESETWGTQGWELEARQQSPYSDIRKSENDSAKEDMLDLGEFLSNVLSRKGDGLADALKFIGGGLVQAPPSSKLNNSPAFGWSE